ncbi:ATPase, T2SS/T4P/T4SS family [Patescibacteria group bacterium]
MEDTSLQQGTGGVTGGDAGATTATSDANTGAQVQITDDSMAATQQAAQPAPTPAPAQQEQAIPETPLNSQTTPVPAPPAAETVAAPPTELPAAETVVAPPTELPAADPAADTTVAPPSELPAAETPEAATAEGGPEENPKLKQLQDSILSANVPQMVMISISYALDMETSDIHIEPLESHVRLRYRIDGVLQHIVEYPNNLHPAIVSRIKIMSNLKIDEQRIPQDGRADVTTKDGREMDLRISTLPTVNGEKIVMRIQDKSRKIPDLPDLGISGISLRNLENALASPNGIIINTGPTGSGKTTTLYSCLQRLNKVDVNILTIEDPVEIAVDGLNQSQVHHDIDYSFASGMRAALRQDPDIIMVGEIRDKETADTAIEASLTGHLVFSTLHTNSAVESLVRIRNMGIQPYLITSSVELIIAQRLIRRLCEHCKKPADVSEEMMKLVKGALDTLGVEGEIDQKLIDGMKFFETPGCDKCNDIGYKGRVGIYEVFKMTNAIRQLISEDASMLELEDASKKAGMITLEQQGILKALLGLTSLDEVYRVARKSE